MALYDLFHDTTGALIREAVAHGTPPGDPVGKGWRWQPHDKPAPGLAQTVVWDPATRAWVLAAVDPATAAERFDALAAELTARVKADAEAASMAWLSPGTAKAQKYLSKREEAAAWTAASSPRDLALYPFALREAAALAGLDPASEVDLATVTEAQVQAVIDTYTATAAAFVAIGSTIEAMEQKAVADIAAARVAEDEAAMRAAALVAWPAPS